MAARPSIATLDQRMAVLERLLRTCAACGDEEGARVIDQQMREIRAELDARDRIRLADREVVRKSKAALQVTRDPGVASPAQLAAWRRTVARLLTPLPTE